MFHLKFRWFYFMFHLKFRCFFWNDIWNRIWYFTKTFCNISIDFIIVNNHETKKFIFFSRECLFNVTISNNLLKFSNLNLLSSFNVNIFFNDWNLFLRKISSFMKINWNISNRIMIKRLRCLLCMKFIIENVRFENIELTKILNTRLINKHKFVILNIIMIIHQNNFALFLSIYKFSLTIHFFVEFLCEKIVCEFVWKRLFHWCIVLKIVKRRFVSSKLFVCIDSLNSNKTRHDKNQ